MTQTATADSLALHQVRRFYQLVDANDAAGVADLYSVDATYHRPGYEPMHGREEVFWFYHRDRIIASGAHQVQMAVADDQQAAVHGRFTGRLHDGAAVDLRFADFFSFDETGLIRDRRTFYFTHTV